MEKKPKKVNETTSPHLYPLSLPSSPTIAVYSEANLSTAIDPHSTTLLQVQLPVPIPTINALKKNCKNNLEFFASNSLDDLIFLF